MKKALNLSIILLFSLMLSQETRGAVNDKSLVKLQSWLKSLGKSYSIQQLDNLKRLELSHKQLKTLPPELGTLKALTYLVLGGNQLKSLPKEIWTLKALTWLGLDGNQLKSLPPEIGTLKALPYLDLMRNPLSEKEKIKIRKLLPKCDIRF
mgnify:CR=1 FL=1